MHGDAPAAASLERGAPAGLSEAWWGDGGKGEGMEGQGKGQGQGLGAGEPAGADAEAMPEQTLGQCVRDARFWLLWSTFFTGMGAGFCFLNNLAQARPGSASRHDRMMGLQVL